jgi:hypothetical protein
VQPVGIFVGSEARQRALNCVLRSSLEGWVEVELHPPPTPWRRYPPTWLDCAGEGRHSAGGPAGVTAAPAFARRQRVGERRRHVGAGEMNA